MDSPRTPEPVKRLSLNLPARLHTRIKTACSANDRTLMNELLGTGGCTAGRWGGR